MVATRTYDSTTWSSRDDSLILDVLDRAGPQSHSPQIVDADLLVKKLGAFVSNGVEHILALEMLWANLSAVACQFGAESLHQSRDEVEGQCVARGDLLTKLELAAKDFATLVGTPAPGSEKLPACRDLLVRMRKTILDPWVELEDLEEIVLAPFQIPNERLTELAKRNPSPQSWYDESFDPFEPSPAP